MFKSEGIKPQNVEVEPGWRQRPPQERDPEDGEQEDLGYGDHAPDGNPIPVDEVLGALSEYAIPAAMAAGVVALLAGRVRLA